MRNIDPRAETTTAELVREAIDQSRELLSTEFRLARDEFLQDLKAIRSAAITLGVAALLCTLALVSFLVALLPALPPRLHPAPVAGGILLAAAVIAGLAGYRSLPKSPMAETREQIKRMFASSKGGSNEGQSRVGPRGG